MATTAVTKKTGSMKAQHVVSRVLIYALLIVVAALMLIPFLWMLSASDVYKRQVVGGQLPGALLTDAPGQVGQRGQIGAAVRHGLGHGQRAELSLIHILAWAWGKKPVSPCSS